jgi:hypothetical protein
MSRVILSCIHQQPTALSLVCALGPYLSSSSSRHVTAAVAVMHGIIITAREVFFAKLISFRSSVNAIHIQCV